MEEIYKLMERNRYLIAIIPPEPIATEIYQLKVYIRDKYSSKASLNSPAHITLHMPFEWKADKEPQLVSSFKRFSTKPFEIKLKDFGCFEPRVIFVDIQKNAALGDCQKRMVQHCKTELDIFNAGYQDHPFHPHITIGFRDLKKNVFEAAWDDFKGRSYSAIFECTRVSLLKHDGKLWREIS